MTKDIVRAAFIIIGDEILSGRTQDANLNFLALELTEMGISLKEVRVVPDIEEEIILALNHLREKFDYIFTSGGIGPTHDDITALSIAKAFKEELILNEQGVEILTHHYGKENLNEARLKMAYTPKNAKLLDNPVSSAPGFRIENVFVMAGVPRIFKAMFFAAKKELIGGKKVKSNEIKTILTESMIAKELTDLQNKYHQITIGSYPFDGGTSLVFRGINYDDVDRACNEMSKIINQIKPNSVIS